MDNGELYAGLNALDVAFVKRDPAGNFLGLVEGEEDLPVVTAQTNPVTGGIGFSAGGNQNALPSALSAIGRIAVPRSSCALIGDSRNQQYCSGQSIANGLTRTKVATHWLSWFNALNGQPLSVIANFALSGTKTADLDGQITSLLALATLPEFAFIWSGVNDYSNGPTAAQSAANIKAACFRLLNAGIAPVVFFDTGSTGLNTSAAIQWLFEYNQRLRDMASADRRILAFDPTAVIWDGAAAAWTSTPAVAYKSGYMADATHTGNLGGYAIGAAFATWFSGKFSPFENRPSSIGEMVAANNPLAMIANALFSTTTGGASSGAGSLTGNIPASWSLNRGSSAGTATTVTSVANANGYGNDLTLAITTTVADTVKLSQDVATAIKNATQVGDIIQGGVEIVATAGTNLKGVNVVHEYNDGTLSYAYYDLYCQNASAGNGPQAFSVVGEPFPMSITTTPSAWITTRYEFVFSAAGGATITLRRAKLRKRFSADF